MRVLQEVTFDLNRCGLERVELHAAADRTRPEGGIGRDSLAEVSSRVYRYQRLAHFVAADAEDDVVVGAAVMRSETLLLELVVCCSVSDKRVKHIFDVRHERVTDNRAASDEPPLLHVFSGRVYHARHGEPLIRVFCPTSGAWLAVINTAHPPSAIRYSMKSDRSHRLLVFMASRDENGDINCIQKATCRVADGYPVESTSSYSALLRMAEAPGCRLAVGLENGSFCLFRRARAQIFYVARRILQKREVECVGEIRHVILAGQLIIAACNGPRGVGTLQVFDRETCARGQTLYTPSRITSLVFDGVNLVCATPRGVFCWDSSRAEAALGADTSSPMSRTPGALTPRGTDMDASGDWTRKRVSRLSDRRSLSPSLLNQALLPKTDSAKAARQRPGTASGGRQPKRACLQR